MKDQQDKKNGGILECVLPTEDLHKTENCIKSSLICFEKKNQESKFCTFAASTKTLYNLRHPNLNIAYTLLTRIHIRTSCGMLDPVENLYLL